jgi:hypothetical protein
MDIDKLDQDWHKVYGNIEPLAEELKNELKNRWLRIHTLEGSKRYAENPNEKKTILSRHNSVLDTLHTGGPLIVLTCIWSDSMDHETPEASKGEAPAIYWQSFIQFVYDDGSKTYRHIYAATIDWALSSLDELLVEVAEDEIAGVIITPQDLSWLYHPYDGGGDIIARSEEEKEELKQRFSEWLAVNS